MWGFAGLDPHNRNKKPDKHVEVDSNSVTDAGSNPASSTNFMNIDIETVGWIATCFLLVGYYLNAKQNILSWLLWVIGNSIMLFYAYKINSNSVAFLSIVLISMNVYGYISWKNNDSRTST